MSEKVILTKSGYKKLQDELDYLIHTKRAEIKERIKVARGHGDLSENSEYDEAKNAQALTEQKIQSIEKKLKNSEIADEEHLDISVVSIGTKVSVHNKTFDQKMEYTIVGANESDPRKGIISNESPIGSGLIGHRVGEIVEIVVPAGALNLEILEIRL